MSAGPATQESRPAAPIDHVVIAVHGIRTYGNWQVRLKQLLSDRPGLEVHYYRYGYFSSLAFLVPFLRWLAARRFRFWLREELRLYPDARIDIVAHSFGTYLVSKALSSLPRGRSIHTLIFAGSVLKPSFPWARYIGEGGTVHRFVNDCGCRDTVLILSQLFALGMGMAGRVGFGGIQSSRFLDRFFDFGHGGYFEATNDEFMRRWWLPLITTDTPPEPHDCRQARRLTAAGGLLVFLVNNAEPVKLLVAVGLLALIVGIPISAHRQKVALDNVRRYAYISRLANASQMPLRDPTHVYELLSRDLEGLPRIPLQAETRTGAAEVMMPSPSASEELEQLWWNYLPFLYDWEKHVFKAMDLHARANAELAVRDANQVPDRSKARLLYEQAISQYQPVKDRARGSYALCLLDYGRLLNDLNVSEEAIRIFTKIREEVFPYKEGQARDGTTTNPTHRWSWLDWIEGKEEDGALECPRSLQVDALCGEATAHRGDKNWDAARRTLNDAVGVATTPNRLPLLLAQIHNEQGWTELDVLDLKEADAAFSRGLEQCELPSVRDSFVAQRLSYHLQHGRAIVQRYRGQPVEARQQFDQLVERLHNELSQEYVLTPKQRRDLRDRMVNSMQRRGDCDLFVYNPYASENERAMLAWKAFALYEAAYRWTPSDDDDTRLLLLFRMYLSRFLAGPTIADQDAARILLEAERGYERLNPERRAQHELDYMTARACSRFQFAGQDNRPVRSDEAERLAMLSPRLPVPDLGGASPPYGLPPALAASAPSEDTRRKAFRPAYDDPVKTLRRQALDDLRQHVLRNARQAERLNRDRVEMLLLGTKILLDQRTLQAVDQVEPEQRRSDATMLSDLLGATLRGSQHEELEPFVRPIQDISARARMEAMASTKPSNDSNPPPSSNSDQPVEEPQGVAPAPDGDLLFYWRITPGLALSAVRNASEPRGAIPTRGRVLVLQFGPGADRTSHSVARPVPAP